MEHRHKYTEPIAIYNSYTMNGQGITYAMQGYHLGDGVTLRSEVICNHLLIEQWLREAI